MAHEYDPDATGWKKQVCTSWSVVVTVTVEPFEYKELSVVEVTLTSDGVQSDG
ncbi:MAG: hypothetical protein ACYDD6_06800 [Acidimicrobiales bacterium]